MSKITRRAWLQATGIGLCAASFAQLCTHDSQAAVALEAQKQFWEPVGMDVMTAIMTRRSHRSFTGEPVKEEDITRILQAGMNAPSAQNAQPWHFVVLQKQSSFMKIQHTIPLMGYVGKAGAAIAVCVDTGKPRLHLPYESTAMCCQNIWLAATGLGYGAVWVDISPYSDRIAAWRKLLALPHRIVPMAFIIIGRPDVTIPPENRFDPARIHYEKW